MMALPEKPTAPRPAKMRPRRRACARLVGDKVLTQTILRARAVRVGKFRVLDELAIGEASQKLEQIDALRLREDKGTHAAVLQGILVTATHVVIKYRVEVKQTAVVHVWR